ncbi:MAG TPA: hypothetical protein VFQ35_15130 [Polyangiaceae bacterium]|nr:hypothetical protein [Polyangiaceae bacterium]
MNMRSLHQLSQIALFASLVAACSSKSETDAELEGVPEQAAFALSVTDDATSEGSATADDAVDPSADITSSLEAVSQAVESDVAPELANARGAVRALNQALRHFMQPIVALVRDTEPTSTVGRVKVWGPVTRGPTEFRFTLRHGTLRHYGWVLEARPEGSNDAFTTVAAGGITVGFAPRRGRGTVGIDLDALASVDPTVVAGGALLARFAHGAAGSIVGYRLRDFMSEAQATPINALVQGVHLKGGTNRLRLAYHGNLPETATAAPELVLARVRHQRGEGGRADLLVTGGDVPNGHAWVVSECWNSTLKAGFRRVLDCPGDGIGGERCEVVATTGDASACRALFAQAELPPADAEAPMSDDASPEGDVTPPEAMPDGAPPADG